jgi:putative membrane protein
LSANFDNVFLLKATQGNMAEVMTGQLAVRKARNPQVRQLAQRLVQEHSAANAQFVPVLARRALPVPRFVGAMHTATYDYLSRLKNQAFDAAYMAAQVEAHENTITLYQQELAQGTDPNARALAATLLPHILDHTAQIYSIAQAVGAPGIAERRVAFTTAATGAPNFTAWTTGGMSGMGSMSGMSGVSSNSSASGSSSTTGSSVGSGSSGSNSGSSSTGASTGS